MVDDAVRMMARVRLPELADAADNRADWDDQVTAQVIAARHAGHSWELIAQVLGVSRQGAWDRYAKLTD